MRRRRLVRLALLARRLRDAARGGGDAPQVDRVVPREVVEDVQPDVEAALGDVDREEVDDGVVEREEGELPARGAVDGVPAGDDGRAGDVGPAGDLGEDQGVVCVVWCGVGVWEGVGWDYRSVSALRTERVDKEGGKREHRAACTCGSSVREVELRV